MFVGQRQDENGFAIESSVRLLLEGDKLSAVAPAKTKLSGLTMIDVAKAIRDAH